MKVTDAAKLGVYSVVLMTWGDCLPIALSALARLCRVSEPDLASVLGRLQQAGIVDRLASSSSTYTLVRDPDRLTVLEVIEAFEGPSSGQCFACPISETARGSACERYPTCPLRPELDRLRAETSATYRRITVRSLAHTPKT